MALHRLLDIEMGAPDPARMDAFYEEIGLRGEAAVGEGPTNPSNFGLSK
ncbi:MAG: hypothetical protein GY725_21485, partial [bacterium]|nr:hypothetical protein [bacterium]